MFDSRQYEWADLTLILGGRDITGIRGIKYSEKAEREAIHAKGRYAHSIQTGDYNYEGEITLLQSELETLIKAGNGSILNLNLTATVSYGDPSVGDAMTTDQIEQLHFVENSKELKTGDKFMEVTLPFICTRVIYQVA